MLLNENIQIVYKNNTAITANAGDLIILGDTESYQGILGVATSEIKPGESGILETSGVFSFDENEVKNIGKYKPVYCYKVTGNKVRFSLTERDKFIYVGMTLTDRATEGGPLVVALGYKSPVYKAPASPSTSNPSGGGADVSSDTSTTVDPSSSSEPGAM